MLQIPDQVLVNYLTLVEEHYHGDVPYHNNVHAADVTQSAHVMSRRSALRVRIYSSRHATHAVRLSLSVYVCLYCSNMTQHWPPKP